MLTRDWDEGQIDRVNMSRNRDISPGLLSRIVRKAADQTSGCPDFQDAVNEKHLLVSEAGFREIRTEDRGRCVACSVRYSLRLD